MMQTKTTVQTARRAKRTERAYPHAPFRPWHAALLLLALLLGWAAIRAPGILADVAAYPVGDWRAFVLACGTVIILAVYALVGVRTYHALVGVGMGLTVAGLGLWIGLGQVTQEPLSLGFTLLLLALAVLPVRVIIRPNDSDTVWHQAEELVRLRQQLKEK